MTKTFVRKAFLETAARYRTLFSIKELEDSSTLQLLFGAMLLYFLLTFGLWIHTSYVSANNPAVACWPYFQNCNALAFFSSLPFSYSQNIFYMTLLGVMLACATCMWRKRWIAAHACLLVLLIWKVFAGFVLNYDILGMYDYYHIILTATLLFFPFKEYFAKTAFVLLYFLSATIKFYPAWIIGTYFTSLTTGLPLIPNVLVPVATWIVVASQTIGCWFLLSRHMRTQRLAFFSFEAFHFYSGFMVSYSYPLITIPALTILFGPLYRYQKPPLSRRAIVGWIFLTIMLALQIFTFAIPGDQKITLEGFRYGAWMFDSNHQCIATLTMHYPAATPHLSESVWRLPIGSTCGNFACLTERIVHHIGSEWVVRERYESPKAWSRCSPYGPFQQYKKVCASGADRVAMQFDHSINGGPFYRIVDEQNICTLSYSAFWHNDWIKEPPEAPAIGYPVQNNYSEFID